MIGNIVRLRAVEPADLTLLYEWENDPENWEISGTLAPYSRKLLSQFIETSSCDIYVNRQVRFMIVEKATDETIGAIDVFDFSPVHRRAGVGLLVAKSKRRNGYGYESVLLVKKYLFDVVKVHQVFCNVMETNSSSLALFQKAGFKICGQKREWICTKDGWVDELILQCIK